MTDDIDVISLADLLLQCESAEQRMSVKNPHRLLLGQCRVALLELAERLRPVQAENIGYVEVQGHVYDMESNGKAGLAQCIADAVNAAAE